MVTTWDLYDSFNTSQVEPTSKAEGSRAPAEKKSTSGMTKDEATPAAAERGNIFWEAYIFSAFSSF